LKRKYDVLRMNDLAVQKRLRRVVTAEPTGAGEANFDGWSRLPRHRGTALDFGPLIAGFRYLALLFEGLGYLSNSSPYLVTS
jgi:hypothetical protein